MSFVEVEGSTRLTRDSGGTAGFLPSERAGASFDSSKLHVELFGAPNEDKAEWEKMFDPKTHPVFDSTYDTYDDRETVLSKNIARSVEALKIIKSNPELKGAHMAGYTGQGAILPVGSHIHGSAGSAVGNHYGIFLGALLARGTPEQQGIWARRAMNMQITGAYAQTELGHGSNVRALETTSTYDKASDSFIIHSPTLTSAKYWAGCFGLFATHAVVYARLLIDGKDHGVHEFVVQLRDADHNPMPGVEIGDIGDKLGYNGVDSGYCIFTHVKVPRANMLARFAYVDDSGKYTRRAKTIKKDKGGASSKLGYIVMIQTRVGMVYGAYSVLAKASTISIRYSAVRHQGFNNTRKDSLASGEHAVLDYQVQQDRLFKGLSWAYAFFFVAKETRKVLKKFMEELEGGDVTALPELHATAAGLKSLCTNLAGDQLEECRRCLGGHGSLLSSGIAGMMATFNSISPIAEGDAIVLILQTARFLVRAAQAAREGRPVAAQVQYLVREPPAPTMADPTNLDALESAFAWRAAQSVKRATAAFEARLKSGMAFDDAWNGTAVALRKAATDHCFYVMLSKFITGARAVKDAAGRTAMLRLANHFALKHVQENGVDWAGTVPAANLHAAADTMVELLAAIRPDAVALVDTFGFSDASLMSTLGCWDGNVYERVLHFARKNPLNKDRVVKAMWRESLTKVLDRKFLEEGARKQSVVVRSRL